MKVFVTGVTGQLGYDVMNEVLKRGYEGTGSGTANEYKCKNASSIEGDFEYLPLDITDEKEVRRAILNAHPDAVIHCAGWTAVDAAEDEDKKEQVRSVNVSGTRYIADACKLINCKLLYISTDYVFDGCGTVPWEADCKEYHPLSVYGQTKLESEIGVSETLEKYFIVRIAWAFGINGQNFVKTILNAGKKYGVVKVVNDQIGTPTYTYDLAKLLIDMAESEKYGFYHATNEGETPETAFISWYDFACEIFRQAGYKTRVIPVTTEEYGMSKAVRPHNSRLDKSKLMKAGFTPLPSWQDALGRYLKLLGLYGR